MTYVTIVSFSKQKLYIEMMLNQKKVWVLKERGTRGTISSNWYHTKNSRISRYHSLLTQNMFNKSVKV